MEFSLSSSAGGENEIILNNPSTDLPFKLAGAVTDTVKGRFGEIHFHHVKTEDFDIWSSVYDIKENTIMEGRADMPVLELHGSVQNHMNMSWDGLAQTIQREDQYNLSFTPHVNNKVHFKEGTRCRTLDFHLRQSLLERYAVHYPLLDKFLSKVGRQRPGSLAKEDCMISQHMRSCLDRIDDYYSHPQLAPDFYELKMKEFLIMLLDRMELLHGKREKKFVFTSSQIDAVHAARDFLVEDLSKSPSLRQLAQKAVLNECVLKKCFRYVYGMSVHQYFISKRMEAVVKLLRDPQLSVPEIALLLGYNDKQNLYSDFKKYFGRTPKVYCEENRIQRL